MLPIRQLAAIMFTDIVGYTALMGQDEQKTLALVKLNKQIHLKWIVAYRGQLLKEIGDGIMARFPSVSDAIYCASAIQAEVKSQEQLNLRMGIHLGEIVVDGKEIYGDGVNIASRIESKANPGEILVSEAVFKNIKNNDTIIAKFSATYQLKNVEDTINTYLVSVDPNIIHTKPQVHTYGILNRLFSKPKLLWAFGFLILISLSLFFIVKQDSTSMLVEADSRKVPLIIAVLPFVDLSPNQDQEYLGDGIAEEIINGLTKITDLKVIGRTSSFSFKNQDLDLQAIAMKLGSNLILEGSIRKSVNKIRITAQLIDAKDGSHIWSENYDRNLDDIFIIQDDISARIAEKLRLSVKLSRAEAPPTKDFNAYELYLEGRYFHFQGLNGTLKARDLIEEAIERDPLFVDALNLLAEIYWSISLYALGDRMENIKLAKVTILRAIELDSTNYDAYGYLGFLHLTTDWDWNEATKKYHQAIDLGLHLPDRNHLYYQAIIQGTGEEVIEGAKELVKSDPLSVQFLTDLSRMYLFSHHYEDVIRNGQETLELSPDNTSILRHMGSAYLASGDMDNALKYYGRLMLKDSTYAPHGYIAALVGLDRKEEALELFSSVSGSISPVKNAFSFMYLGELDSAFHYLDKAFVDKDSYLSFIKIEPHFQPIKNDPRYLDLVERMNFPEIKPISK